MACSNRKRTPWRGASGHPAEVRSPRRSACSRGPRSLTPLAQGRLRVGHACLSGDVQTAHAVPPPENRGRATPGGAASPTPYPIRRSTDSSESVLTRRTAIIHLALMSVLTYTARVDEVTWKASGLASESSQDTALLFGRQAGGRPVAQKAPGRREALHAPFATDARHRSTLPRAADQGSRS